MFLNQQEKAITIFLSVAAIVGSIRGIFRHNWLKEPEILLSPQNLPEVVRISIEKDIVADHQKSLIEQEKLKNTTNITRNTIEVQQKNIVETVAPIVTIEKSVVNKTESIEKKVTKNTSGIININIASKEDFMALLYIGEVKDGLIVQLRNKMGVFTSIKDLEKVKGIGPKTLARIEPFITI